MVLLKPNGFLNNPYKTREDVEAGCRALLDPLAQHTSPGGALLYFASTATHYDLKAVALEAFARPLWGLASLIAGGGKYEGADRWIRGFAAGTDPTSPEYWGGAKAKDQRMVEMSPLSFAICMAPEVFFQNQTDTVKRNIGAFLETCIGKAMPDTNWLWFRVFANLALRSIGSASFNPGQMARDLARLEEFQLPGHEPVGTSEGSAGWSRDGPEGVEQLDYYSGSFAIQFAQLTYAKLAKDSDPERAARYRQRAIGFCQDLVYYFDENGSGIPFGRSMVYRFAIIGAFSALAMADVEPLPLRWGHIKGLVLRHLRSWNADADIFRSDGTLTIGYKYDNMNMTENYNAPGSPYWCMKAFACLAAPASHPFWTSEELPFPTIAPLKALPDPGHIMCRFAGHTFLLSSGQFAHYYLRHASAKYGKFAYSSTFGFSCPSGDLGVEQVAGDSMLALRDISAGTETADGETWRVRRLPIEPRIVGRGTDDVHLRSKWRPWSDVEVETWLVPSQPSSPAWYLRVHKITSGRKLATSEGGWSTYGQGADGRALYQAFSGEMSEGGAQAVGYARAATRGGCAGVFDLSEAQRNGNLIQTDPNSNVIFSRSILPALEGEAEGTVWLATAVFGCPPGVAWEAEWEKKPVVPAYINRS